MQSRFTITAILACLALAGCSTVQPKPKPSTPWIYQTPKPHGAIYRFFHPKSERMWKGVSPALREKVEAVQAQLAAEGYDVRPVEATVRQSGKLRYSLQLLMSRRLVPTVVATTSASHWMPPFSSMASRAGTWTMPM